MPKLRIRNETDPCAKLVESGWTADESSLMSIGITQVVYFHERMVGKKYMSSKYIADALRHGKTLRETGGRTDALVYVNGLLLPILGTARCNTTDKYDRRFGERLALCRAISQLAGTYSELADEAKALLKAQI